MKHQLDNTTTAKRKAHATFVSTIRPSDRGCITPVFSLSPGNLLPEALEVLATLKTFRVALGQRSSKDTLPQQVVTVIETKGTWLPPENWPWMDEILSALGTFLLLQDWNRETQSRHADYFQRIGQLFMSRDQQSFLKTLAQLQEALKATSDMSDTFS